MWLRKTDLLDSVKLQTEQVYFSELGLAVTTEPFAKASGLWKSLFNKMRSFPEKGVCQAKGVSTDYGSQPLEHGF